MSVPLTNDEDPTARTLRLIRAEWTAPLEARLANTEHELVGLLDSLDESVSHEQIYAAMRQLLGVVRGDREEISL